MKLVIVTQWVLQVALRQAMSICGTQRRYARQVLTGELTRRILLRWTFGSLSGS